MTNDTDSHNPDASAEPSVSGSVPQDAEATVNETHAGSGSAAEDGASRLAELEGLLAEAHDKWVRSEAEMQNLRARTKREVEDARQYAVQKFARDTVEAAENLRRALSSIPAKAEGENDLVTKIREGIEGTERSFLSILERHGVVAHDAAGQPFDANLHQAMAEQPSTEHEHGTVIQAWTPAWTLHGRLLKPAMVVVAKNEGGATAEEPKG
ncbi:MAG: nucleotide exchange factor GrpE [Acetobacter sp.]|jgi:molecular chaperone GrpE|nr:nucleotide exchange factor GrpE [Acetobacter sp.]